MESEGCWPLGCPRGWRSRRRSFGTAPGVRNDSRPCVRGTGRGCGGCRRWQQHECPPRVHGAKVAELSGRTRRIVPGDAEFILRGQLTEVLESLDKEEGCGCVSVEPPSGAAVPDAGHRRFQELSGATEDRGRRQGIQNGRQLLLAKRAGHRARGRRSVPRPRGSGLRVPGPHAEQGQFRVVPLTHDEEIVVALALEFGRRRPLDRIWCPEPDAGGAGEVGREASPQRTANRHSLAPVPVHCPRTRRDPGCRGPRHRLGFGSPPTPVPGPGRPARRSGRAVAFHHARHVVVDTLTGTRQQARGGITVSSMIRSASASLHWGRSSRPFVRAWSGRACRRLPASGIRAPRGSQTRVLAGQSGPEARRPFGRSVILHEKFLEFIDEQQGSRKGLPAAGGDVGQILNPSRRNSSIPRPLSAARSVRTRDRFQWPPPSGRAAGAGRA